MKNNRPATDRFAVCGRSKMVAPVAQELRKYLPRVFRGIRIGLSAYFLGCLPGMVVVGEAIAERKEAVQKQPPEASAGFSPDKVPGLELWLTPENRYVMIEEADNRVSEWTDRSGHGFNLVSQGDNRPLLVPNTLNGRPILRFSGSQCLVLRDGTFLSKPTGLTFIAVVRANALKEWDSIVTYGNYASPPPPHFGLKLNSSDGRWCQWTTEGNLVSVGESLVGQGFKILAGDFDARNNAHRLYENGVEVGKSVAGYILEPGQPLCIGSQFGGYAPFFNGDIAEALIYNKALAESERKRVEEYLMAKYALNLTHRVSRLAANLPFAYYPSRQELEVAVDRRQFLEPSGDGAPQDQAQVSDEVEVAVVALGQTQNLARGKIKLDAQGRGQGIIKLPDLKDGEYGVEYQWHAKRVRSPKTFKRVHFPWEGNSLGLNHTIYPPFEPVRVKGTAVSVVGRTYQLNGFGLFEKAQSKGRELLAAPIQLVYETDEGRAAWTGLKTNGKEEYPDLAVFESEARSGALTVRSRSAIEEDGCMRVDMDLLPGERPREIRKMWIEIPLKQQEASLFHYATGELRHAYGQCLCG
ncbi:MAG: hypothetical protein HY360_18220 [Verrucomicrobia bacterium]|nr:hypothetical protein [Verrucomicrobiota bacterium]